MFDHYDIGDMQARIERCPSYWTRTSIEREMGQMRRWLDRGTARPDPATAQALDRLHWSIKTNSDIFVKPKAKALALVEELARLVQ